MSQYIFAYPVLPLTLAAFTDWKDGIIPNWITYPFLLGGLAIALVFGGTTFFLCNVIAIVLLLFYGLVRKRGAGDVKLLMVIASSAGPLTTLLTFLAGETLFALVGFLRCWRGSPWKTWAAIWQRDPAVRQHMAGALAPFLAISYMAIAAWRCFG